MTWRDKNVIPLIFLVLIVASAGFVLGFACTELLAGDADVRVRYELLVKKQNEIIATLNTLNECELKRLKEQKLEPVRLERLVWDEFDSGDIGNLIAAASLLLALGLAFFTLTAGKQIIDSNLQQRLEEDKFFTKGTIMSACAFALSKIVWNSDDERAIRTNFNAEETEVVIKFSEIAVSSLEKNLKNDSKSDRSKEAVWVARTNLLYYYSLTANEKYGLDAIRLVKLFESKKAEWKFDKVLDDATLNILRAKAVFYAYYYKQYQDDSIIALIKHMVFHNKKIKGMLEKEYETVRSKYSSSRSRELKNIRKIIDNIEA